MNKKGQGVSLAGMPALIVLLTLTVLLGAAAAIALNSIKNDAQTTSTSTVRDNNSTFTLAADSSPDDFATSEHAVDGTGRVHLVTNSCADVTIYGVNGSNITSRVTVSGCTVNLTNVGDLNGTAATANYTYNYNVYHYSYNISEEGEVTLDNVSEQLPTVGTILGVGLIMVVILAAFVFFLGGNRGAL